MFITPRWLKKEHVQCKNCLEETSLMFFFVLASSFLVLKKKKKGGTRRGETKAEELLSADERS